MSVSDAPSPLTYGIPESLTAFSHVQSKYRLDLMRLRSSIIQTRTQWAQRYVKSIYNTYLDEILETDTECFYRYCTSLSQRQWVSFWKERSIGVVADKYWPPSEMPSRLGIAVSKIIGMARYGDNWVVSVKVTTMLGRDEVEMYGEARAIVAEGNCRSGVVAL